MECGQEIRRKFQEVSLRLQEECVPALRVRLEQEGLEAERR